MTTQELSALGIVTAAVVYLLAFMAHAMEWASARTLVEDGTVAAAPATDADTRVKVDMWGRMGTGLTLIALAAHALGVVLRGLAAHRAPWGNMYEFTISALLFVAIAYVVAALGRRMRWLGLPTTLLLAVGNGLAATVFYVKVAPLVPALHSVWFVIHIVAACISGAAFNLGAMASILYLLKSRAEQAGTAQRGYLGRVPSARDIDTFAFRAHAFAFPVWTFTIAAGSVWADYAWGRFWGWDPKETWALVTWIVYAIYLHARLTAGWRGRPAAMIALLGVVSFWFNFVGVNLFINGLHSYAGI